MVNKIKQNNKTYYQCEICKFLYEDKSWAERCEAWCEKNKSCNLKITKHSIQTTERRSKNG